MQEAPAVCCHRIARLVRIGLACAALWLGWEIWYGARGGNFFAVLPGRIYRGAQPSATTLDRLIADYRLRTVVNLRGCCTVDPWYIDEARVCQKNGVNQEDLMFSATRLPSRHELRHLVEVIERSDYPLFFHCRQGADRTGLACATALLLQPDVPYAVARRQLGPRYLHLPIGPTAVMDAVLDLYDSYRARTAAEHSPALYRRWLLEEYRGGWCQSRIDSVDRLFRDAEARVGRPLGFRVRARNLGANTWRIRPNVAAGMHLGSKLYDADGKLLHEVRGGLVEADIAPGQVFEAVLVLPPLQPGRYRLLLDMIEEGHCWFYQTGAEPREEELVVHE